MTVELELQIATNAKTLPHPSQFKEWVGVVFSNKLLTSKDVSNLELTIRIVDEQEIIDLNGLYRHKNELTNVLSFSECIPDQLEKELNYNVLGDIVICASVVEREAKKQNKELLSHWAHMVVHGILHLLGYDHENSQEANEMENIEINLMKQLGFTSPYTNSHNSH